MRRRAFILVLTVVVVMVTLAGTLQAAVVVRSVLTADGYRFRPKTVEVAVGTKVTWQTAAGSHTVTATSKNWSKDSPLSIGAPTSFTFTRAGTYRYRCTFHSNVVDGRCQGQCGRVVVG